MGLPSEQINLPSGTQRGLGWSCQLGSLEPRCKVQHLGWKRAAREEVLYKQFRGGQRKAVKENTQRGK